MMTICDVEGGYQRKGLLQLRAHRRVVHGPQAVTDLVGGAEILVGSGGRNGFQQGFPVHTIRCRQQHRLGIDARMVQVFGE